LIGKIGIPAPGGGVDPIGGGLFSGCAADESIA
jgi:hypothetical protein